MLPSCRLMSLLFLLACLGWIALLHRVIPTPFKYFCFLVLRPSAAGAQHQKKKFGGGEAAPEPPLWGSILTD